MPVGANRYQSVPTARAKGRAVAQIEHDGARSLNAACDTIVKPRIMTNAFHGSGVRC